MALQSMLGLIWVKKVHNFWKYFDLSTKLSEFLKFQNKNFSKSQISIFPPTLPWKSYNFLFSSNLVHYDMRRQIVQPKTQPRQQTNAYNCDRKSIFVYALYLVHHFLFVFNFFRIGRGQIFRRIVCGLFGFGFFGLQTASKGKCCWQIKEKQKLELNL